MAEEQQPAEKKPRKKSSAHPLRDNIEVVVFAVVMALGLKVFALEAYQIPTGSMQPTLMGTALVDPARGQENGGIHDRVLVDKLSFLLRDPRRWEVVVFRYPLATHTNYVKRLVGLPGEWIWIQEGDLYARQGGIRDDSSGFEILRKPVLVQESIWKRVFPILNHRDRPWAPWRKSGPYREEPAGTLLLQPGSWIQYGMDPGGRMIEDDYRHGYPDAIFNRIQGARTRPGGDHVVTDLKLEFAAAPRDRSGPLLVQMDCGPFPIRLTLPGAGGGEWRLEAPVAEPWTGTLDLAPDEEVEVSLAFWDHRVRLLLDGDEVVFQDLELEPTYATHNGVGFDAGREGVWRLGVPEIFRDIHYLPGLNSNEDKFLVPLGEYFMMGDNTQNSLDSRDWQAAVVNLDPPLDGLTTLRGDLMEMGAQSPIQMNPRKNRDNTVMTFRDTYGNVFTFPTTQAGKPIPSNARTVPREYIIGKVMMVFLPIPPFSPVVRIRVVR